MLARDRLTSASLGHVKQQTERIERIKAYARTRLRAEVQAGPRGTQARLVEALETTSAHVANMVNHDRGPGQEMLHALARHWGITYAELERTALGETSHDDEAPPSADLTVVPEHLQRVLVRIAKTGGYDDEVLQEALRTRALRGASAMSEAEADELLQLTKTYLRSARRIVSTTTVVDSGGSALDELGGGAARERPTKRR